MGQYINSNIALSVQHGNQYVQMCDHRRGFRLQPLVHQGPRSQRTVLRKQPSQLLLASNQVVKFVGRVDQLRSLRGWRESTGQNASALLLHAPGGVGKTRLAMRFAEKSQGAGWTVVVAQRDGDGDASAYEVPGRAKGLLVVVDYAERWPSTDLLALFSRARPAYPTRVLLLARSQKAWWAALASALRKLNVAVEDIRLPDLHANLPERREMFQAACSRFAEVYETSWAGLQPAGNLDDPSYRNVLQIHMAALAAVDARSRGDAAPSAPRALSSYLLDREREYWTNPASEELAGRTVPAAPGRVAFLATLLGPMSWAQGAEALCAAGLASDQAAAGLLLDDHCGCYPPMDESAVLEPLTPDRLGEDLVARLLPDTAADAFADSRMPHLLELVLVGTVAPTYRSRAIQVLVEAAKRWSHVRAYLNRYLKELPEELVAMGGATLLAVARFGDAALLEALEPHLPQSQDFDLDAAAAVVVERRTEYRLAQTTDRAARAGLFTVLGWRLGNAEKRAEGRTASQRAVEIYRELFAAGKGEHAVGLAKALHDLGTHHAELGEPAEALSVTEEAMRLRTRLARSRPDEHEADLAASLHNVAADRFVLGDPMGALAAAEQAVAILGRLAAGSPRYEHAAASALHNVGAYLTSLGQFPRAAEATAQAVVLYRGLVERGEDRYDACLAAALRDMAGQLARAGLPGRGAELLSEAVLLESRLARGDPARHQPTLAAALRHLTGDLSVIGADAELANAAAAQMVDLSRRLAAAKPGAHDGDLAAAAHAHAVQLARRGRAGAALDAAQQAVSVRYRLAETCREKHERRLIEELRRHGLRPAPRPSGTGQRVNGWRLVPEKGQEAAGVPVPVDLQQSLATLLSEGVSGGAKSYENHRDRRRRLRQIAAFVRTTWPTMMPWLVAAIRELDGREADFARSLGNLSARLAPLGRTRDALSYAKQSVDTFQHLGSDGPDHYLADLALALANLALRLTDLGRYDRALTTSARAAATISRAGGPAPAPADMASVLWVFGWVRGISGTDLVAGLTATRKAREIYDRLFAVDAGTFRAELRSTMVLETKLLGGLGRDLEALKVARAMKQLRHSKLDPLRSPQFLQLRASLLLEQSDPAVGSA